MKNKIILFVQNNNWMALHEGALAREIHQLFGTHVLPTAFTDAAAPAFVRAEIAALNPAVEVVVAGASY